MAAPNFGSSSVSFDDVVRHTLKNLEDAALKDNVKTCKTLTQNLLKEIILGQRNQKSNNRRVAVERGVVQSVLLLLQQFSVSGSERDQTPRLQLVVTCLDLLLDLKPFVLLDDKESVPVCILLRSFGVGVVVKSMMMHWNLHSRSVPLLCKSLRVLVNVSMSEQGARMLVDARTHAVVIELLAHERIRDRDSRFLMLRILSAMVLFCSACLDFLSEPASIELLLSVANSTPTSDYSFHKEICCILCTLAAHSAGAAQEIMGSDPLGYVVQVLHSASSKASSNANASVLQSDFEHAMLLQEQLLHESQTGVGGDLGEVVNQIEGDDNAASLEKIMQDQDAAVAADSALDATVKAPSLGTKGDSASVLSSMPNQQPSQITKSSSPTMDSINSTAKSAYSAGSQLVSSLIRKQPNKKVTHTGSPSGAASDPINTKDPYADDASSACMSDARRVSCWAAMLMHNLCLAQRNDVTMRMVISQAFEASLNVGGGAGSGYDQQRPIFARVAESMQAICASSDGDQDKDTADLIDFGSDGVSSPAEPPEAPKEYLDQLVDDIVLGSWSPGGVEALHSSPADADFSGRAILFNLELLRSIHGAEITIEALFRRLVARFSSMLDPRSGPRALPLPPGCSRIVSFAFFLLGHPIYQRELAGAPRTIELAVGPGDDSLLSLIRLFTPPEYFSVILRCLRGLVDVETKQICILPVLPYTSFRGASRTLVGLNSSPHSGKGARIKPSDETVLNRQSSLEYQYQKDPATPTSDPEQATSPGNTKRGSPAKPNPASSTTKSRSKSVSVVSPSRFSRRSAGQGQLKAQQQNGGSFKELRSSNPYMPSNSHVVLSPLLNDLHNNEESPKSTVSGGSGDNNLDINNSDGDISGSISSTAGNDSRLSVLTDTSVHVPPQRLSLFEWRENPQAVAIQLSLRLEKLYVCTDPGKMVLLAMGPRVKARKQCGVELHFIEECHKVSFFLKREVLSGDTSFNRARIIECVIDMALCAASSLLRNAALAMACVEALTSSAVRRLELSWRNVSPERWQQFDQLKGVCGVLEPIYSVGTEAPKNGARKPGSSSNSSVTGSGGLNRSTCDDEDDDVLDEWELNLAGALQVDLGASTFLSRARIPYMLGVIAALRKAAAHVQVNLSPVLKTVDSVSLAGSPTKLPQPLQSAEDEEPDLLSFDTKEASKTSGDDLLSSIHSEKDASSDSGLPSPEPLVRVNSLGSSIGRDSFDPLGLFSTSSADGNNPKGMASAYAEADECAQISDGQSNHIAIDFRSIHINYAVLCEWIPTIRSDGDWFQRIYAYQPDIQMQILLKQMPRRPPAAQAAKLDSLSLRQEPPWALDQMLIESLYAIEGWIEALFESEVEEEGKVILAFRAKIRNQDRLEAASSGGGVLGQSKPGGAAVSSNASVGNASAKSLQSAAANIFRGGGAGGTGSTSSSGTSGTSGGLGAIASQGAAAAASSASSHRGDGFRSSLDSLPKIPASAVGKLVNSLVKKISVSRRARLLQESGSRSAEHWEKIAGHVRLTVERIVLSPLKSRLSLAAMREHIKEECALQERTLLLRSLSHARLSDLLGLPCRKGLDECKWEGAVATLRGFDYADMPSLKIKVLLRLKDDIFQRAAENGVNDMNADEFLPVMTYVIIKAQLQHPYATTMLLRELLSDEFVSGEAAYYLTTFEIALGHLLHIELPKDVLDSERRRSALLDDSDLDLDFS